MPLPVVPFPTQVSFESKEKQICDAPLVVGMLSIMIPLEPPVTASPAVAAVGTVVDVPLVGTRKLQRQAPVHVPPSPTVPLAVTLGEKMIS